MRRQFFSIVVMLLLSACSGHDGASSSTMSASATPQKIDDLSIPDDFDYATSHAVELTVDVAPVAFANQAYVVIVYNTVDGCDGSLVGKFVTDQNGQLNTIIQLSDARTSLKIVVQALGFPNEQVVAVEDFAAVATFR